MPESLRVFVIGQTPRPDIEEQVTLAVPGLPIRVAGALDGMTREEITRDACPRNNADALFTVLPSGETTEISKAVVTERLTGKLDGDGPALLLCTGAFPGLPRRSGLVMPSEVLNALSAVLLPEGRLGLFVPLVEQMETLRAKRSRPGLAVQALPLRPLSDEAAVEAAAREMAAWAPELIVMDCMSYTRADKALLVRHLRCPILLSIEVAARVAASLLPG